MTHPKARFLCILAAVLCALSARAATAVPVPFANCGRPTDIISVQQMDASVWPPVGTPAPLQVTATYNSGTGDLVRLRVALLYGPDWIFETDPLNLPVVNGFVTLPATLPVHLLAPALPIAAGPYDTTEVFTSSNPGSQPVTIHCKAVAGQAITSADGTFTLTFNGSPGFPTQGGPGVYSATMRVLETGGQEVFCATFSLPDVSFIAAQSLSAGVPTLPGRMLALLAALLVAAALFALRPRAA